MAATISPAESIRLPSQSNISRSYLRMAVVMARAPVAQSCKYGLKLIGERRMAMQPCSGQWHADVFGVQEHASESEAAPLRAARIACVLVVAGHRLPALHGVRPGPGRPAGLAADPRRR